MKKIIYYILTVVLSVSYTACSDYLTEEPYTDIDKNNYMRNASEAQNVLLGVYRNMVVDAMYGYHISLLFPLGTDISQVEGNTNEGYRIVATNSFSANQIEVQQTWSALYNGIYNANNFIEGIEERIDGYPQVDQELATIYMAEARSLRALFYFELLRLYGHIALLTNTAMSNQHPSTFVQEDPVKVYEFIEQDLQYAIKNLPYAVNDTKRSDNSFRFSKGAALGLLAKVYATWAGYPVRDESKWKLAAEAAEILIASNKHGLLSDYEQLWKNAGAGIWDPAESLIEVSFYSPTAVGGGGDPVGRIGKWNGVRATEIAGERGRNSGVVRIIHPFVLDWRTYPEDLRRDISVANYRYNPDKVLVVRGTNDTNEQAETDDADPARKQSQKQTYTPGKWDTEKYVPISNKLFNNDRSNINWYVLRYADILLLYAEAVNEWRQGPTEDAYAAVNMVRRRGYGLPVSSVSNLADLTTGLNVTGFREVIRQERAFELSFEGHRRMDLIRWGVYYETVQATAVKIGTWWQGNSIPNYVVSRPGYTTKGKHELYPIPQRDIDLMAQFEQNPGWK